MGTQRKLEAAVAAYVGRLGRRTRMQGTARTLGTAKTLVTAPIDQRDINQRWRHRSISIQIGCRAYGQHGSILMSLGTGKEVHA